MIKKCIYYEVYDDFSDDGRGNRISVIGRFSSENVASAFAIGNGNYGNNARVRKGTFIICDSIEDIKIFREEEERETALNKLTDREKQLLGLVCDFNFGNL